MKFYIAVEEKRSTVLEVKAENWENALEKAEKAYGENEVCLNHEDYIDDGACFYDETDMWRKCMESGYCTDFQKIS